MQMPLHRQNSGFTIIELMVVVVLLLIVGSLVALTYSGVRAKDRNAERQADINSLQAQLELFYAQTSKYPTTANLNDAAWRKDNFKKLSADGLTDPRWASSVSGCVAAGQAIAASEPLANCYSYQVTASDGSGCDNGAAACAHYTLTASLEGGETYVKTSMN